MKLFRVASAMVLALVAGGGAWAQGKGESVKFQDYPGIGNMLVRVAISKGYCDKYGIKCSLQPIPSGPLGAQAMLAKSIDASFIPAEIMVGAITKGAKMKMVVGGAVANTANLIAGNHTPVPNAGKGWPAFMQDLKGKKIGVPARGSLMETTTTWMLLKSGLKAEDVTFVAVGGPVTAYGALVSKQVDGIMMFEPGPSLCDVLGTCKVIWRGALDRQPAEQYALNGGGSNLVFTQDYIERNPHVIESVIKAVKDADAFINGAGNFEETVKIAETFFKFDMPKGDEVLRASLKAALEAKAYSAAINRNSVKAGLDFLVETRQIDKAPPVSEFVFDKAP
ncbi:MAG: ABC transporter substrate-binding protein [Betaproteobacteria bacterium]|nr:ABC transporter substrate-binding protein [Betaproteobacteria bacterium]